MALVHQSGGGTGFSFSRLRPKNDIVRSTMGVASGPVSFMSLYDASTDVVKQGGTRRGANMGILRVDHPDILEFITCKDDIDQDHQLQHLGRRHRRLHGGGRGRPALRPDPPQDRPGGRASSRPGRSGRRSSTAPGRPASPGSSSSTAPITTTRCPTWAPTRPPIPAASSRSFPTTSATWARSTSAPSSRTGEIDWDHLRQVIHLSTHFLENVIDANNYPLPEIDELSKRIRRIGLGVMGLADLLVRLGIPYDSEEGVEMGRKIQKFVDEEAKVESERLAVQRGRVPRVGAEHLGPRRDLRPRAQRASGSGPCAGSGTATSPPWRPPAPSPSSPAAARASSRCSRWRSCGTRPAS